MRVSSESDRQNTNLQRDALQAAGVDTRHLYEDRASGAKDDDLAWPRRLNSCSLATCLSSGSSIDSSARSHTCLQSQKIDKEQFRPLRDTKNL